jgi:hypothetical protein
VRETGADVLLARERGEDPLDRAARRAHDQWITWRRVWNACDRAGVADEADRVRFIFARLWPDLRAREVERAASEIAARKAAGGPGLLRPVTPADVVGDRLANLLQERGYWRADPPSNRPSRVHRPGFHGDPGGCL